MAYDSEQKPDARKSDDNIKSSTRLIMPALLDLLGLPDAHCGEL